MKKLLLLLFCLPLIFSCGEKNDKEQEEEQTEIEIQEDLEKHIYYESVLSFIVEGQSDTSNLSAISGMANMIGLDMVGGASSSFNQQDIIELLKSRKIIERTLNNKCEIEGKSDLFLNHYIRINNLITDSLTINLSSKYYNDSMTNAVYSRIIKRDMSVLLRNDDSILDLTFKSLSAEFAKNFTEIVIDEMSEMYIYYQIERHRRTLNNLEKRDDSVSALLTSAQENWAAAVKRDRYSSIKLDQMRYLGEMDVLGIVLQELRKNIELTRMSLLNETPLIQVIDKPVLPLKKVL